MRKKEGKREREKKNSKESGREYQRFLKQRKKA